MEELGKIESTATLYVLKVKGGYYNPNGGITQYLSNAQFFPTKEGAIAFRKFYDPRHRIDRSTLLRLALFVTEVE